MEWEPEREDDWGVAPWITNCTKISLPIDADLWLGHGWAAAKARRAARRPRNRSARESSIKVDESVAALLLPGLQGFIDRVIVPALVERLLRDHHAGNSVASRPGRASA
jgi:hypothetical protein